MGMRRKCLGIFVAGIILLAMFLPCGKCGPVEAAYHGGSGTAMYPYEISKVAHLQNMSEHLDAYWELWCDIDASETSTWNAGAGFLPISTFTGSFDGKGYTINDLFIDRSATSSVGLFGVTNSATIQNVALVNVNITGDDDVGGLIGYVQANTVVINSSVSGTVEGGYNVGSLVGTYTGELMYQCHSSGTVVSTDDTAGGLVGFCDDALIHSCYSTASITSTGDWVGGLIGHAGGFIAIYYCYATGDIIGDYEVGGLIGGTASGASYAVIMSDCYARGDVNSTSPDTAAGLICNLPDADDTVTNCYSTGEVVGDVNCTGGLIESSAGTVTDCFWDTQTSGEATSDGGTGKNTSQMKTQSTFTNWSFYSIWAIDNITNDGYPYFGYGTGPPPIWDGEEYVPSNLLAIPISSSEIALVWDMGANTTETRIMGKTGGWPSTYNDPYATLVYEGDQTTVSHKGLDAGTTYYYRAWGRLGGGYSVDYAQDLATTLMGAEDNVTVPMPPWWFQEPSCTAYANLPIFGLVQNTAESYDVPENTACLLITIFLLLLAGIIAFVITHNALTSGMVLTVAIVIASIAGLLPMWMLLVALLMVVGITFSWSRA